MDDKIFIPFSEDLFGEFVKHGAGSPLGELVPYQLEYRCVRLLDGTFEFEFDTPNLAAEATRQAETLQAEQNLPVQQEIVHAA